ncbi:transposase-like protein [Corynebacterium diphtheriae HC02]|nr:transposase-like protein [Corynebacterium diphtheriae HC02]CAB0523449.1 transposase [Corynebacterium diphtheriae]CAB0870913.1 transposase [Corynebacterium diphtheriae]CAB0966129.1 transposase [Corynebacterium diphtheriae]
MDPQFIASQLKNFDTFVTSIVDLFQGFPKLIQTLANLFDKNAAGWKAAYDATKKAVGN